MGQEQSSNMESGTTPINISFLASFNPLNLTSTGSTPESDAYYSTKVSISLGFHRDRLVSTRAGALSLVQGQQAKIPELIKNHSWETPAKHPRAQELSDEIQAWLRTCVLPPLQIQSSITDLHTRQCSTEDELNHLIGSDIAGFASWMVPKADLDKARWVCYYLGWVCLPLLNVSKH